MPVLLLSASEIKERKHEAPKINEKALAFVHSLSDEELCYLCTGNFEEGKEAPGLGGASVPGAAGESTLVFEERGIKP